MNPLWTFVVYNVMPFAVLLVAIASAMRVFWVLGLRTDCVNKILECGGNDTKLHLNLAELHGLAHKAPESVLMSLSGSSDAPNRDEVLRIADEADMHFWHRIRRLESWVAASTYLTGLLVFVTFAYVASSLYGLVTGLSVEIEHNTSAILDVLRNILLVIMRCTWVASCLFLLNTIVKNRVNRRKECWITFLNRLTNQAIRK